MLQLQRSDFLWSNKRGYRTRKFNLQNKYNLQLLHRKWKAEGWVEIAVVGGGSSSKMKRELRGCTLVSPFKMNSMGTVACSLFSCSVSEISSLRRDWVATQEMRCDGEVMARKSACWRERDPLNHNVEKIYSHKNDRWNTLTSVSSCICIFCGGRLLPPPRLVEVSDVTEQLFLWAPTVRWSSD